MFFLEFLGEMGVELVPAQSLLAFACDGLDGLLDLVVGEVELEHLGYLLQGGKGHSSFILPV